MPKGVQVRVLFWAQSKYYNLLKVSELIADFFYLSTICRLLVTQILKNLKPINALKH